MRSAAWAARLAAVVVLSVAAVAQSLGIGDPAPKLRVSNWVRGAPVESFEREHVYVVEFWATWCLPCRKSIPMLTELQARFADRNVHIIGVSVREENQAIVAPFVTKMGDQMRYTVATDLVLEGAKPEQGSMVLSWLKQAGEVSLPTAFIVDGSGKIAWIGDSLSVEKPLEKIVAGAWDIERARTDHKKRVSVNSLRRQLNDQILSKQWEKALATIEEMRTLLPETELKTAAWRFNALLRLGRETEAYEYGKKCFDTLLRDEALDLNVIAWAIVDPEVPPGAARDLDFALKVAERAVTLTDWKQPALLDTLALVHFERGNFERAIEIQEKAVQLAAGSSYHEELAARLERFKNARKAPDVTRNGDERLAVR